MSPNADSHHHDCDHGQSHSHAHNHSHHHHAHHHAADNIKTAFVLNFIFAIVELVGGTMTGSVAILSGALHDLGDSLSLGLAWFFENKSKQAPTRKYSYGYRRYSLLSAVVTAVTLVVGSILVMVQAIPRLFNPHAVNTHGMIALALGGVLVNGVMAWKTHKGNTLNEQVISWHLMEDVLSWSMVLIVGVIMSFVDFPILDPILSLAFSLFILRGVMQSLMASITLFLQAAPEGMDTKILQKNILDINGVEGVHDLHVWSLDGDRHILSVHVVLEKGKTLVEADYIKNEVRHAIASMGNIHATIEVESNQAICPDFDCVESLT